MNLPFLVVVTWKSMQRPAIRILDAAGSPEAIGAAHGTAYAHEIVHYTQDRIDLVTSGLWSGGPIDRAHVLAIAEAMVAKHEAFDAALHTEMVAMAAAAGITPAEAIIGGGFTDFVDAVRAEVGGDIPASVQEDDCTAVIIPNARANGHGFLAQTWDMHDSATDHVLLMRLQPTDRPAVTVFTTTGCLGQIGMNEAGLCVGINNLTALDGTPGVTWPSVVRGMLGTESADDALAVLLGANLAGAHNYLILDKTGRGYNVEAMPSIRPVTALDEATAIVHTNHVIDREAKAKQAEKANALMASSFKRRDTAEQLLSDGPVDEHRLFDLLREPDAICQVAMDPYHIESSGAAVMRPATGQFWACWGLPTTNDFELVSPMSVGATDE
ncbi:MAG: hypothetical protein HKN03_01920 [Acidimicrobiales bacterium]|nr:hypothetical protein [Acidimicrobiales bacterium]